MKKFFVTFLIFESLLLPKINKADLEAYAKEKKEKVIALTTEVEKEKRAAEVTAKDSKEFDKYYSKSQNLPYMSFLGDKKGTDIRRLLAIVSSEYAQYEENKKGLMLTVKINDIEAKKDMKKEEYFRYLNKGLSEVDETKIYTVAFDYNDENIIEKITIFDKDKYT